MPFFVQFTFICSRCKTGKVVQDDSMDIYSDMMPAHYLPKGWLHFFTLDDVAIIFCPDCLQATHPTPVRELINPPK